MNFSINQKKTPETTTHRKKGKKKAEWRPQDEIHGLHSTGFLITSKSPGFSMARFHVGSRAACGLKETKFYTTKSHKSHGKWFDIPYILWSGVAKSFWNVKIVVPLLVFWSISFANKEKFQSTMDGVAVFTYSARLSTGPVTTASLSVVSWGNKEIQRVQKGNKVSDIEGWKQQKESTSKCLIFLSKISEQKIVGVQNKSTIHLRWCLENYDNPTLGMTRKKDPIKKHVADVC